MFLQSEGGTYQIKFLVNSGNKQTLFFKKLESKTAVMLTCLVL